MKRHGGAWIGVLLAACFFLAGCTTTLQETKATDTDPGESTKLKFTGNKVKVVHDF